MRLGLALVAVVLCAGAAEAEAQTCSFDQASGLLTVDTANSFGTLKVVAGAIELDGVPCGTATTTSTERIVVNPTVASSGRLTLIGRFAPGRDPEVDEPEIEIDAANFDGRLYVHGSPGADDWRLTAGGLNLNGDLDEDLVLPSAPSLFDVYLRAQKGNDVVDASAYSGARQLNLQGGPGDDVITGSGGDDVLAGDDGNDVLYGGAGHDLINDGAGDDQVRGGPGNDSFWPQFAGNLGRDDYRGGSGIDTIAYVDRAAGVNVSLDGSADDGEPGEGDNVRPDVEDIWGGDGDDVLVGSSAANHLRGLQGRNELYGGAGDDDLDVGYDPLPGIAMGDGGNDYLNGSPGADLLDGGDGDDSISGNGGNDTLDGGAGADQYYGDAGNDIFLNADAVAETVDCGAGTDDPEPDPLDTFIGCENI